MRDRERERERERDRGRRGERGGLGIEGEYLEERRPIAVPGLGHRHEMGVFRPPDPRGARDCALTRRTALHLSRERERRNVLGRELNVSLQTEEERE